jgi:hypothetical protein
MLAIITAEGGAVLAAKKIAEKLEHRRPAPKGASNLKS